MNLCHGLLRPRELELHQFPELATGEITMTNFLLPLASMAALATTNLAWAQLPPTLGGTYTAPGYVAPSYPTPGYVPPGPTAPGYTGPSLTAPGYTVPSYTWREQRANEDWRNNTWREQRANEDWRTNNWRQQRANEDWRQREQYAKERMPNNAIDQGYVEPGTTPKTKIETKKNPLEEEECGVGTVKPICSDNAKDKTKNSAVGAEKNNGINRGYGGK